eukprot:TRINITY_DN10388_c0_g1_i2.p1 TRINITY_DN10388_c0_g1~~TRINITY_DN10388_c0_g1_i2.p1  ORF type:complete len:396 (+),score=22.49 TRINITY_DN10388_c0_g1_i2:40-1188(+)
MPAYLRRCMTALFFMLLFNKSQPKSTCSVYVNYTRHWYDLLVSEVESKHECLRGRVRHVLNKNYLQIQSSHGFLINGNGVVRDIQSHWQIDCNGGCCQNEYERPAWNHKIEISEPQQAGTIVTALQRHGTTYFHSVWEVLPRILNILWHTNVTAGQNTSILTTSASVQTTLAAYGSDLRVRLLANDGVVRASAAILPANALTISRNQRLGLLHRLTREAFQQSILPLSKVGGVRRMVLIRRDPHGHHGRAILNSPALMNRLRAEFPDFDIVDFNWTMTSFRETVQLWHDADVVIGPHGAGMTNLVWICAMGCPASKQPPTLFELIPPHQTGRYYHRLAEAAHLKHVYYEMTPERATRKGLNWQLDISRVLAFVKHKIRDGVV